MKVRISVILFLMIFFNLFFSKFFSPDRRKNYLMMNIRKIRMFSGEIDLANENYEKSLKLNPLNNAKHLSDISMIIIK